MFDRNISFFLKKALYDWDKIAFVSGPRQVGKTTWAKRWLAASGGGTYFNWDVLGDQKRFVHTPYFFEEDNQTPHGLVVLDEIHKHKHWKNYLKGAYDRFKGKYRFIVTGSGRLDIFQRGGDSLLGRYAKVPLFPMTLGELSGKFTSFEDWLAHLQSGFDEARNSASYLQLFALGGFPEPLFRGEKEFYEVWRQSRRDLLIREDIRDATNLRSMSSLELLSHMMVERVGSPVSYNALREDLQVAFQTAQEWVSVLEAFYYLFLVRPYASSLARLVRKETKAYLFDWGEVSEEGLRYENLVALHLLKAVTLWRAFGQGDTSLHFIRDREKHEVDFVVAEAGKPVCLIETKKSRVQMSRSLLYFQKKLKVPVCIQLVHTSGICAKKEREGFVQWTVSVDRFLQHLP